MALSLKPLHDQVIVITGASSGIGLATAKMAAKKGAKLVLASRGQEALSRVVDEITAAGGEAIYVVADVGKREDVQKIADTAIERFGRFDTWVNDAGIGIWGKLEEVSDEDSQALFQTNFWGVVHGSLVAVKQLKKTGGALINLGSIASDIGFPLQAMYAASKHAILGFTDGLRDELAIERAPVSVTLIKPAAIGTPFGEKARNYLAEEPKLPAPVYKPEDVAIAILRAATHPVRDIYVGGGARILAAISRVAPKLVDLASHAIVKDSTKHRPAQPRKDNLDGSASEGEVDGEELGSTVQPSLYTRAVTHPATSFGVAAATVGVTTALALYFANERDSKLQRRLRRLPDGVADHLRSRGSRYASKARDYGRDQTRSALRKGSKYGDKYSEQAQSWLRSRFD